MSVHYKFSMSDITGISDEKKEKNEEKYNDLKIRMEENIKLLKEQVFQTLELSFKNKADIQRIEETFSKISSDLAKLTNITNDYNEYKKITNERIEKIFKLVMMNSSNMNINHT